MYANPNIHSLINVELTGHYNIFKNYFAGQVTFGDNLTEDFDVSFNSKNKSVSFGSLYQTEEGDITHHMHMYLKYRNFEHVLFQKMVGNDGYYIVIPSNSLNEATKYVEEYWKLDSEIRYNN